MIWTTLFMILLHMTEAFSEGNTKSVNNYSENSTLDVRPRNQSHFFLVNLRPLGIVKFLSYVFRLPFQALFPVSFKGKLIPLKVSSKNIQKTQSKSYSCTNKRNSK